MTERAGWLEVVSLDEGPQAEPSISWIRLDVIAGVFVIHDVDAHPGLPIDGAGWGVYAVAADGARFRVSGSSFDTRVDAEALAQEVIDAIDRSR